jgi:multicomponent Na+:H+ antiporter subunit G
MTLDLLRETAGGILVVAGSFFVLVAAIGINRMPDVFTRLHAASVGDTLGFGLVAIGLMLIAGLSLVTVKLLFLLLFVAFAGPVVTHAIARAALHAGLEPKLGADAAKKGRGSRGRAP